MTQSSKPEFSVIVPCYNVEHTVKATLESLNNQTVTDFEVILVNDGSTDNTQELLEKFTFVQKKIIVNKINNGLGAARNSGIKISTGKYIALLDADDLWMSRKLELQIPLFQKKTVGLVYSNAIYFYTNGRKKKLYKYKTPPTGKVFKELLNKYFLCITTVIISKKALESMNYWFDPNFSIIEEYDLFIRISYLWELSYYNDALAKYRIHDKNTTFLQWDKIKDEKLRFLNNCYLQFPNFERDYKSQINNMLNIIEWFKASEYWLNRNYRQARQILYPFILTDIKWLAYYIISYIPYLRQKIINNPI